MAEHPDDLPQRRTFFDRFAEAASRFVSEAAFFLICTLLVVVWVPTIFVFHSVDTWQLVLNTVTSVMAFLLIALLQNSERRYDVALHTKVNTLAAGLAVVIRHQIDGDTEGAQQSLRDLEAAISLEERM